jgi:EmrB/QacA subfamily drug resistance transporter
LDASQKLKNRWFVLGVMCISLFIISIDTTVLNLALPSIANGFKATTGQLQWVVDAYSLIFASLLITTGALGDRYGRRLLLIIGLALFGIGSLGAALSVSTEMLIAFRAVLGMAGALIMPSTLSILIDVFRDGKERAKAIAIWSSIFSIGAGIGPLIGGFLIGSFHWSSVFYLNLPVVAIGIAGCILFVPESRDARTPKPDFPGVVLSIVGVVSLVYATILIGEKGWGSPMVWASFGVAAVFLTAFGWWEKRSPNPMLPFEFFKNRNFSGANIALTLSAFAMMGSMYLYSQFFQSIQGYFPLMAAICMLPMTPFVLIFTLLSVRINRKMGTKFTMGLGLLCSALGAFLFSQLAGIHMNYWWMVLILFLNGAGAGLTMSPATSSIMNSLPPNRAGIGSAMNDTTRQLGGALGVAVLGALLNSTYRAQVRSLVNQSGITDKLMAMISGSVQSAHVAAQGLPAKLGDLVVTASSQAFVNGMRLAFLGASIAMLLAVVMAWVLLPSKKNQAHIHSTATDQSFD